MPAGNGRGERHARTHSTGQEHTITGRDGASTLAVWKECGVPAVKRLRSCCEDGVEQSRVAPGHEHKDTGQSLRDWT
jgi:uncharacterized protein YaeQ